MLSDLVQLFFYDLNQEQNPKIYHHKKFKEKDKDDKMEKRVFCNNR